jgi:hypothetical protein
LVGTAEGAADGAELGTADGTTDGADDGAELGTTDGSPDGYVLGEFDGVLEGFVEGEKVGKPLDDVVRRSAGPNWEEWCSVTADDPSSRLGFSFKDAPRAFASRLYP